MTRGERPDESGRWLTIGCGALAVVVLGALAGVAWYLANLEWPPVGIN